MSQKFNYNSPDLTDAEIAEITAPRPDASERKVRDVVSEGTYTMKVQNVRAQQMGQTGKLKGEIFFVHAGKENAGKAGATLSLFRSAANPSKDSSVTSKTLYTLGKKFGLSEAALRTISWAEAEGVEASEYGSLPAAILFQQGNEVEVLNIEGATMDVAVGIESFTRKDGTIGTKNYVKAIL